MGDHSDKVIASSTFVAEDVQQLFDLSREEAEEWLSKNRKYIEDSMSRSAFACIETLGVMDGLTLSKDEE